LRYHVGRTLSHMPHHFDGESFGQLLHDTQNLRDLASTLERKLAHLAATDASSISDSDRSRLAGELDAACAAAHEQAAATDTMLRRLAGPVDPGFRDRPIVLVVDDSQDARDTTALLLEQAGFRAVTATNGLEALIVAHYTQPAVALLDLMMPVLDGLQTARLLSESPSTRQVKVIAYSGRADMFSRRLPGTFTAILSKPTTPEELLTLVQQQAGVFGGAQDLT
jgi:CheY-like chemotaxis protein